jgi:hypothetical protein
MILHQIITRPNLLTRRGNVVTAEKLQFISIREINRLGRTDKLGGGVMPSPLFRR